jgi:hypothetical protein
VILGGLLVQVVLFSEPVSERIGALGPPIYVGSTVAVIGAIIANRAIPGMLIVALGAASNLAAIVASGGYMPMSAGAAAAMGGGHSTAYSNSALVPDPMLAPLTDIFALPMWLPFANVFSIGDIVIGVLTDLRRRAEIEQLVGYLLTTLSLRSRPGGALTFRDYLGQVRDEVLTALGASDAPFDLVLLLDLSGSNSKKLKMIRNSAKRFVDAARPTDRIAVVTFTEQPALYSSFTLDRVKLKKSIDEIDDADGGTNFWDSLDWVIKVLIPQSSGRRSLPRSSCCVLRSPRRHSRPR